MYSHQKKKKQKEKKKDKINVARNKQKTAPLWLHCSLHFVS